MRKMCGFDFLAEIASRGRAAAREEAGAGASGCELSAELLVAAMSRHKKGRPPWSDRCGTMDTGRRPQAGLRKEEGKEGLGPA